MARQNKQQKDVMERVMHEYKHGDLETSTGRKVKNRRQAVAIGLSEAGASNQETPNENARNLRRTKARERRGETGRQRRGGGGPTKAELYEKAKRRNVAGRSKMSKAELQKAVG